MASSTTYDKESQIIKIRLEGRIDKTLVRRLAAEAAQLAKEYDCYLILSDAREATSGLSTLEILDLPKEIAGILSETGIQVHKFKRALVVSTDVDDFAFFESVSRNRAQNVMIFRSFEEARSWLLGK